MRPRSGKFITSAVVAAAMLCGGATLAQADNYELRIIHMNDIHSHLASASTSLALAGEKTYVEIGGIPRAVTKINNLKAGAANHLVLNAGDTFQGTLFYTLFDGKATADMLNHIGWDAITLGNHEFDDGDQHLANFLSWLNDDIEIVSANVEAPIGNVLEGMWEPYVIKNIGGQDIGIIGIDIAQKTQESSNPSDEIVFYHEVTTVKQYVAELEGQGINKIILLSHYGLENDMALASQVEGVDVIIDGDSHSLMGDTANLTALGLSSSYSYPEIVTANDGGTVCIAQAWEYSKMVGSLDVVFNEDGTVASCTGAAVIPVGETFLDGDKNEITDATKIDAIIADIAGNDSIDIVAEDQDALTTLESYQVQVDELQTQTIGSAAEELSHIRIPNVDYLGNTGTGLPQGSEIAPIVAKSFYDLSLRADACIQNAGGVRINIPEGEITYGTAYELLPFANTLFELEMTGDEIQQVLEDALANYYDNGGSSGSFPYAYALRYDIDVTKPAGMRISNLEIKDRETGAWSLIDAGSNYVVVTNSYTAAGKDGYDTFATVQEERDEGVDTYLDYAMSFVQYVETLALKGEAVEPLPAEDHCIKSFTDTPAVELSLLGTYATGVFDGGAAEIVAHDPVTQQLFVVNGDAKAIDILDISDPKTMVKVSEIDIAAYGSAPNSVAVKNGLVAVAVESAPKQDPGKVVFFSTTGKFLKQFTVGALPDMVTFTPDGSKVLVANEGEPDDEYAVDPEGSVSIIDMSRGLKKAKVRTADFKKFNRWTKQLSQADIRVFGPNATPAQDFEPEYIAVSPDSRTAWVSLQENNAMAEIDLWRNSVSRIISFGYKDHDAAGNGLDASDKDDMINIVNWPIYGMYQPDAISAFHVNGKNYIITANEGDSRDYDAFSEEERVQDLSLDSDAFPDAETLLEDENLGRINITTTLGDKDGDGDYEALYSYGSRSFSIWKQGNKKFKQVYDSGDLIEQITAAAYPDDFNSGNDENGDFDGRSDNKGPEPEGVAHGIIKGRHFAFVGLERMGGIMAFDVSNPKAPEFIQYMNNRDFSGDAEAGTAGDLGPEGITFIPALDSPTDNPLLAVANEVSGTTSLFEINADNLPDMIPGDINNDGKVSRKDMKAMRPYLWQSASVFAECDLDGDGWITFRDMSRIYWLMR